MNSPTGVVNYMCRGLDPAGPSEMLVPSHFAAFAHPLQFATARPLGTPDVGTIADASQEGLKEKGETKNSTRGKGSVKN